MNTAAISMDALRRIVHALRLTHGAARGGDLSAAQLFVLRQINATPGLSLSELAARTLTSPSTVSEVASRLAERGLIARATAPDDQRRAVFTLTADGRRAVLDAPASVPERLRDGFTALSSRDQRELARVLTKWVAAAGLESVDAAMFFEPSRGARRRNKAGANS